MLDATEGQSVIIHYDRTGSTEKTMRAQVIKVSTREIKLDNGERYLRNNGYKVGNTSVHPKMITLE